LRGGETVPQIVQTTLTYDDFTAATLDHSRWSILELPRPGGGTWRCEEPSARIEVGEGTLDIQVGHLTRGHDRVQIFDDLKHQLVSTRLFHAPHGGQVTFSAEIAATNFNSSFYDWRDGQATFALLDPRTGWSFRTFTTSHHVFAMDGRMRADSTVSPYSIIGCGQPWLSVLPGLSHRHDVTFDLDEQSILWEVDGALVCNLPHGSLPSRVQMVLGITTLQPIRERRSQSARGQGVSASFGPITISMPA
jgi:Family of unknown function (DUF6081)